MLVLTLRLIQVLGSLTNQKILKRIIEILIRFGAREITLFGSYARGDQHPGSDMDLIVEFDEIKTLVELCRIKRVIKEDLNIDIDLITKHSLSKQLLPLIQKDMKVVYHSRRAIKLGTSIQKDLPELKKEVEKIFELAL